DTTAFKLVSTGEISREIQSSPETCGVRERMVPMVMELTKVCCKGELCASVVGTKVVLVLKNGTSSPTLIMAVWLLSVRILGVEITSTVPCCLSAVTAAEVLKFE